MLRLMTSLVLLHGIYCLAMGTLSFLTVGFLIVLMPLAILHEIETRKEVRYWERFAEDTKARAYELIEQENRDR